MFWNKTKVKDTPDQIEERKVLTDYDALVMAVNGDELELIRLDEEVKAGFAEINSHVKTTCNTVDGLMD